MAVKEAVMDKFTIGREDVGPMPAGLVEDKVSLTTAITKVEDGGVPSVDYGEDEATGFEGVDASHLAMPFLIVLQSNTPIVKKGPLHLEGAEEGMFYNQATGELFDGEKGIGFIAAAVDHVYTEFFPREDDGTGGGFVGIRPVDDPLVIKLREEQGQFGKLRYEEGVDGEPTEIGETFSLAGHIVRDWEDPSSASRVVVPFASTKIQGYKKFMSFASDVKYRSAKTGNYVHAKLWSHRYTMRTVFKQKGNNSWYVIELQLAEKPKERSFIPSSNPFFKMGEALHKSFTTGAARVAYEKMEAEEGPAASTDTPF